MLTIDGISDEIRNWYETRDWVVSSILRQLEMSFSIAERKQVLDLESLRRVSKLSKEKDKTWEISGNKDTLRDFEKVRVKMFVLAWERDGVREKNEEEAE